MKYKFIELNKIKCKNDDVVKFYLYESNVCEKDYRWANEMDEYPTSVHLKLEIKRDGGLWISWRKLPWKKAYQTYLENLELEYNFSLEEYPESYIEKTFTKDEFFELAETVLYRKPFSKKP